MKKIILLSVLLLQLALAQKVDPYLQHLLNSSAEKTAQSAFYLIVRADSAVFDSLEKQGFDIQVRSGNLATVIVSEQRISELMTTKGIVRISYSPKAHLLNSIAVTYQNVQAAYNHGYTGKNVIVGTVDTGIDFYHPMFRKANGDTRILSIWDQTVEGTHPDGFDIGSEYTEAQINQDLQSGSPYSIVKQKDVIGHGTHVAGSLAGDDLTISPPDTLHGGAIEANMVIVKTTMEDGAVADAVQYIFNKAQALGKPCVVNISLGKQYGPHDGTSDANKFIDLKTGPGKIVVYAAGNDGGSAVHYKASDVTSSSQIQFGYTNYLTFWLEQGDVLSSASLSWSGGSIGPVSLNSQGTSSGINLYVLPSNFWNNDKISILVQMDNASLHNQTFTLTVNGLNDKNGNGHIIRHAWADSSVMISPYDGFSQGSLYGGLHYPYTLSDDACGKTVISVGAFITRESWTSVNGTWHYSNSGDDGGIATFSSVGPTADERNKPEIIAGGMIVLSARSSTASYSDYYLAPAPYTDGYAYKQGTSMAAPVAAGAIALLLEKKPTWGPDEVRNYLAHHAQGTQRPDGVTSGQLKVKEDPDYWDPVFGYGAVDLTDAFTDVYVADPQGVPVEEFRLYPNFPNPFNPSTIISYRLAASSKIHLNVYNVLGQKVKELVNGRQGKGLHHIRFNAAHLAAGVYYYRLQSGNRIRSRKMLLLR